MRDVCKIREVLRGEGGKLENFRNKKKPKINPVCVKMEIYEWS